MPYVDSFTEPQPYKEAIKSLLKEKCALAMERILVFVKEIDTWALQTLPEGRLAIPSLGF